ncbi:Uncharacterized conserved protein, DUF427 family [Rhizobiales bacterium GAS191]|jgi:uncharacterized protein (DUF427 family)|nr:Uncharacterized conserved protein, DUF427 family [Rhizobiales bacterium GAS113]SEC00424.1 Uncharacterized conserved protein, DUF427 family [Rhizobiales bacterium GAS191]
MTSRSVGGTPEHPITVDAGKGRTKVSWKGAVIADSAAALDLKEASYPVVKYVPRADADMSLLRRTSHTSHCPYKGDASYFSIVVDGEVSENAVWTYENPLPGVAAIKEHLAFYPSRVDRIDELG